MAEGWIKLHRQILDNAIFKKPEYLRIWIYILLKANHRDVEDIWNNQKKVFKKGSVVLSQKKISSELKVPLATVNNVLKYLKAESQIEIITTSRYTEIQILKWDDFQDTESTSERWVKAGRKLGESKLNADTTLAETNKNDNNSKNEKNEKEGGVRPLRAYDIPFPIGSQELNHWIEWEEYRKQLGKKITKATALKQFKFLGGRAGPEICAILNQSILNGWTGLFELKNKGHVRQSDQRTPQPTSPSGQGFGSFG